MAACRCISMFFKERVAASERYQWATASESKKCTSLELCPLKKYFEVKNRLKKNHDGNIFFISEARYFYVFFVELL